MNRRAKSFTFKVFGSVAVIFCCTIVVFLFGIIFWNGIAAIHFDFISSASSNFGKEGGILYQILGSLLLVGVAGSLSFPIGLGIAIFKSEYINNPIHQKISTIIVYALNGIPSVIYGIFGLIFFVNLLQIGISWFVGSIILALMILPTIVLASYQAIRSIPQVYRESALALGFTKWQVVQKVLIPQAMSGAVTGGLIGLARAIGETAPIMFIATAFSGVTWPTSLVEPVLSLPTHILALAQQATDPVTLQNAWGTSFVLLSLVIALSSAALALRIKNKSTLI